MSKKQTNEQVEETQGPLNGNLDAQDLATNWASNSLSRRSFLSRGGASTAVVAAASVGLPSLLSNENADARGMARIDDQDERSGDDDDSSPRISQAMDCPKTVPWSR